LKSIPEPNKRPETYIIYGVPQSLPDIDLLEAQCLYALWLRSLPIDPSPDEPVSVDDILADVQVLASDNSISRDWILIRLKQLVSREYASLAKIARSGRAGRKGRGFKIASSDKILKLPVTAAALDFLVHHDSLPLPNTMFFDEVLTKRFFDHKSNAELNSLSLDNQIRYCLDRGYIVREKEAGDGYLMNAGPRTKSEIIYLRLLGGHAQPGAAPPRILREKKPPSPERAPEEKDEDKKAG
jgi:hypothetical protein